MHKALQSLCFSLCLCLTAALASAAPFVSSHGYILTPPPGWHTDQSGSSGNDIVIFTDKGRDSPQGVVTPNLGVRIGPQGKVTTLGIAKQGLIPLYKKGYPNVVLVSQTYSLLGGQKDLDTTFLIGEGMALTRMRQVLVIKNHLVYFFTSATPNKVHAKYDPAFAQILASVRWK